MNKKNIIVIVVVVLVAMIAMQFLTSNDTGTSTLSADISSSDSVDAKSIYALLQKMQTVTLTDSIFANSVFQNLKDNSVTFAPQEAGRANPFSPVGSDASIPTQSKATTTSGKN